MSTPSTLDASLVNRAAPPGSMRYFSLLYAPEDRREALTALFVIDAEIRESAQSANHDVAHTRLRWWRAEVDRLTNGEAQHPASQLLRTGHRGPLSSLARLHELLVAADMDLARMTYVNARELRAYCARSGGTILELLAAELSDSGMLAESVRSAANTLGIGIRQAEILRDLRQDAYDGRVYLPLEDLEKHSVPTEALSARQIDANVRSALKQFRDSALENLSGPSLSAEERTRLRPLWVLAALHRRLLDRIDARDYDVASERIELGPIEKPWVAWRAARKWANE